MSKTEMPSIRFGGFDNDWEQRKFSELYARSSEKNDGSIGMDKNITVATMQFKNDIKVSTTEYLKTYYTFKLGDIAFEGHQSKEFRYGRFVENDIGNGIVSHIFAVFRPIQEYDLYFWKYAINNETLMQRILARSTKASTMMHDLVANDFLNETFLVPSVKEQKQIGAFLNKLDNLITLHQRKYEKLQAFKVSMLEKMFPKDGADVPEVRFKGFDGSWEKMPASELFTSYVDKGHPELPVLSATQDAGMVVRNEIGKSVFHEAANEVGYKRVLPGQFVIHLRSFQGGFAHSAIEGITSPAYTVFGLKEPENHDDYFWKYVFMSKQFIKRLETVTYGIRDGRSISYDEFLTLDFLFPRKEEQSLICQYLLKLDSLIAMRKQELDKLQFIKKALLEKMFV